MTDKQNIVLSRKQWISLATKAKPEKAQKRVFIRLLRRACKTEFGEKYGFKAILQSDDPIKEFQQKVPLHDYNKIYNEWWYRTEAGEKNITWPGKVKYFALSSGTSQAGSKKIPVSRTMMNHLKKGAFRVFTRLGFFDSWNKIFSKGWLAIGGSASLDEEGGRKFGYLSGINANIQPLWARMHYKPGRKIARISGWNERLNEIAKKAPRWGISVMVGIPHWMQMVLEEILKTHQIKTVKEIWPDLRLIITGGVSFEPYRKTFEKLIGQPVMSLDTYLASEGFFAFQHKPQDSFMKLLLRDGIFFEFIPFNEENFDDNGDLKPGSKAYFIRDIRRGVEYAMVISTVAGAWRYLLGDTIRFVRDDQRSIVISGRTKHYLNLVTEHVTIDNLNAAVQKTQDLLQIEILEFTVAGFSCDSHFIHRWYVSIQGLVDDGKLKGALDESLKDVNDDYRSERETLLKMELEIIPLEYFYAWQLRSGSGAGQVKVPRVVKGKQWEMWKEFVESRKAQS